MSKTPIAIVLTLALTALVATWALAHGLGFGLRPVDPPHPHQGFTISGRIVRPLRPGSSRALNLRLTNRHHFDLRITRLTVSLHVDRAHVRAGCDRGASFHMRRLRARQYPIRLRARRTRSLHQLHVRPLPRVYMRLLPTNQDACKNARINLRFAGVARRWTQRGHR